MWVSQWQTMRLGNRLGATPARRSSFPSSLRAHAMPIGMLAEGRRNCAPSPALRISTVPTSPA